MPESAEVETTRRGIAPHDRGRRVARIDVYDSRLRWPVPADVALAMERQVPTQKRRARHARVGDPTAVAMRGTTCAYRLIRSASLHP